MKKILILLFSLVFLCSGLYAQQKTISGIVTDAKNEEPLIGVSVVVKGTTIGVMTDVDGKYTIQASAGQTLTYSYIGMNAYEVNVTGTTPSVLNVKLQSDEVMMDDVVVVGYGVTKRRDLAGAISSLKPDDIEAGVISNMSQLLKGRAAGVQVRQNSLEPGGGVSIRVRGASSVSAENEPLYVVDGFQTDNMTHINPDDIESIEILKDASTTAIYGARGANGVILITTKKGKSGQFNVEYSYSGSVKMMYNPWDLLDAGETIALTRRLYEEDPTATSSKWTAEQAKYRGKGTDWVEETTRNATTNLHQLSVSGGSDKLTAFASANYMTEPGILLNTDYERFGGRTNINYKISNSIRAGANMSFAHSKKKFLDMGTVSSDKNIMYRIFNLEPWKDKEGYDVFGTKDRRPGVFEEMQGAQLFQKYNTMYASVFAEVDLLPSLTMRGQYTYGYDNLKTQKYYDRSTTTGQSYNGQAFVGHEETTKHQIEGVATWHQKFGEIHDVKAVGGASYIFQNGESDEVQAYGFASDVFSFKNMGAAEHIDWIGSGESSLRKASFFGRAEYVLNNKYIFNASFRTDGSSVFGANNRWGYFPAGSVAWHIGDESFMDFSKSVFSRIKLRTSYGLSGNDGIRFGLSQYQYSVRDVYIGGSNASKGMYPSNPYNPDLKWETTAQWNIGTDLTFLNGRIEASLDFYIKRTKDLLNPTPIHPSGGFPNYTDTNSRRYEYTAMMVNDGKIDNRGFEIAIKSTNISTKDFNWSSSFNFSTNRSRVLELNNGESRFQYIRPHGSYDEKEYIILQEGKPLSAIYGYVFDGIIQQGETYSAQPNSVAGDPKFKDINGDGIIDDKDREVLGHGTPGMMLGLSNTFTYKGFDFSFFLDASLGGKMLNLTRIYLEDNNRLKDSEQRWTQGGRVMTDESGNSYTTTGYASTTVPRKGYQRNSEIQYGSYINSRFVENSDYLKLRNIELGYTLPLKKWGKTSNYIKNMRVFVGAQNLFTITGYKGFDPDTSTNGSSAISQGLDLNSYPTYRTFNFGAKVTF
ncbi:TonB-linked SusC/RagA family outer membrane protein [Dysgonomonas hofstadii]|uniref:TonB-linked SusC/RagA family outer membrane protein n=1 Tax=Dysgonomonas hofstadii TaxID=637886 RepID=A0A840CLT7_9BACT|nr:TonB-dependent receptor [Dysgonomonas hofstadii]MBB4034424.1 TonB-linked SusC/RagA family outer membrane protein [Dysgonomonas hofstadii]